jgi:Alw26I/Eco31I/Esp3I family type II restriction m6 adenine DNA methyltransferase
LEEPLDSIAWSILSAAHGSMPVDSSFSSRVQVDAIRLAALNHATYCRSEKSKSDLCEDEILFQSLSYASERAGVSKREVLDLMFKLLNSLELAAMKSIQKLPKDDFALLLGRIHSFGSYDLPTFLQQSSSQRPLGAFYTPRPIADYIVSATLETRLKECLRDCKRHGVKAFTRLLALRTVDPACGTGIFLISAFYEMQKAVRNALGILEKKAQNKREIIKMLQNSRMSLYGVDMDAGAIEVADISLRILESGNIESLSETRYGVTLKKGNSLISLGGLAGNANHQHFFKDSIARMPFEWQNEFQDVFVDENRGFDFVVMNPPYERLKPNYAEFMREQLISGQREVHMSRYDDYKFHMQENIRYFRESNEFGLATSYSLNTYQLFIERALHIARKGGSIGCIVPSNILSDVSAQLLRRELILKNHIHRIDDFPESARIFPGVTQSVSILVFTRGGMTDAFEIGLQNSCIRDARRDQKLVMKKERIEQIMGDSLVIPRVSATGLASLELMHKHPSLSSIDWIAIRRGELDLTLDKRFISHSTSNTRMIRGSHIRRFRLTESGRIPEFVLLDKFKKTLEASKRLEHVLVRRIACQQISNMGQRWRLKFAPIEAGTVLSNSCNYLVCHVPDQTRILDLLLGILSSELLNWRFQISNSNNHVSIRELQNLPIVPPSSIDKRKENAIIQEVRKLKAGTDTFSAKLESSVFSLYGFGRNEAQEILQMRKCPEDESEEILHDLSSN